MGVTTVAIGNQRGAELHGSARSHHISHGDLRTVRDLLIHLQEDPYFSMLRTTAGHVSSFLNVPVEQLPIDALFDIGPAFRAYLKDRRFKRHAVHSYSNFAGMLLRRAKGLGWEPCQPEVPQAWESILTALKKVESCVQIIRYAIRQGKTPANFCDSDLNNWGQQMIDQGRSYQYVRTVQSRFRRRISQGELAGKIRGISFRSQEFRTYGVPLRLLPKQLRDEVSDVLTWKEAAYAEGRRHEWKHKKISAKQLEGCITQLYGFVTHVEPRLHTGIGNSPSARRKKVSSLVELVTERSVRSYVKWSLNDRKLLGESVSTKLGLLFAALRQHPNYRGRNFNWFSAITSEIPPDPESGRRERKERKYLPYDVVADVPRRIHERRESLANLELKTMALLVRDELLMSWLVILPWRQLNIRECRIGSQVERVNLFKGEISPLFNIAKPRWVRERMEVNPREEFWQYRFWEDETKNHREVHSILPRRLISLLEEYVGHHRSALLNGSDPGTLFLNEDGRALTRDGIGSLVSELTLRYAGKRVTPHLFRDIFAYWWLKKHPEDYLTVSKKLWHRNVEVTLQVYGCKFNESQADCRVEEDFENCRLAPEYPAVAAGQDGEIIDAIRSLISRDNAFQALPPAAKQKELTAIASIMEARPWLARLFGAGLQKNAISTAQGFRLAGIRGKSVA